MALLAPSATVVSAEPFLHGTGTLRCLEKDMATYRHWSVSLWRDPDDVSHCRILSPDKTEWRLITATLCGWRRCFVADQLWFSVVTVRDFAFPVGFNRFLTPNFGWRFGSVRFFCSTIPTLTAFLHSTINKHEQSWHSIFLLSILWSGVQ